MLKKLPTSLDELRGILRKLKDREVRLEADLAIRDYPELEEVIIAIIVRLTDVKTARDKLEAVQPSDEKEVERLRVLTKQALYYRERLASIEAALQDTESGVQCAKLQTKYANAQSLLGLEFTKGNVILATHGIQLRKLLPSLDEFLVDDTK